MTNAITIGNQNTESFLVRYYDGTEIAIACQQAWLADPFTCFTRVNETWSNETIVRAIRTASIFSITPVYREDTPDAIRAAGALPKDGGDE